MPTELISWDELREGKGFTFLFKAQSLDNALFQKHQLTFSSELSVNVHRLSLVVKIYLHQVT